MPKCKKCAKTFPNRVWIDGQRRNVNRRKYCFECSPWGGRNTRVLESWTGEKVCPHCESRSILRRNNTCDGCYARRRRARVQEKLHSIVGEQCWICGYGDTTRRAMLDFHHVDKSAKTFLLNVEGASSRAWKDVLIELEKCALLCCRCHREVEAGILDSAVVERVYRERWQQIRRA